MPSNLRNAGLSIGAGMSPIAEILRLSGRTPSAVRLRPLYVIDFRLICSLSLLSRRPFSSQRFSSAMRQPVLLRTCLQLQSIARRLLCTPRFAVHQVLRSSWPAIFPVLVKCRSTGISSDIARMVSRTLSKLTILCRDAGSEMLTLCRRCSTLSLCSTEAARRQSSLSGSAVFSVLC